MGALRRRSAGGALAALIARSPGRTRRSRSGSARPEARVRTGRGTPPTRRRTDRLGPRGAALTAEPRRGAVTAARPAGRRPQHGPPTADDIAPTGALSTRFRLRPPGSLTA